MRTIKLNTKKDIRKYCDKLNDLYGSADMVICSESAPAFGDFTTYYTNTNIPVLQQNRYSHKVDTFGLIDMKPVAVRKVLDIR